MNSHSQPTMNLELDKMWPYWLRLQKGIALIDDDSSFLELMTNFTSSRNIKFEGYLSLTHMPSFAHLKNYDLIIIDYHLESFIGTEIAEYIDAFFSEIPVVIISNSSDIQETLNQNVWPKCIKAVVHKKVGPYAIIKKSLKVLENVRFQELFARREKVSNVNIDLNV